MKKINFSKINKRQLTLVGLVVVIAIAGYINVNYEGDAVPTMATVDNTDSQATIEIKEEDVYETALIERDEKRSKSMDAYREIVNNPNCDKEVKDNAQRMLTNSASYINDENVIENMLRAKGIDKSVVYISENDITVLVFDIKLDELKVAQIKDIICEKVDISAEKIKILENN